MILNNLQFFAFLNVKVFTAAFMVNNCHNVNRSDFPMSKKNLSNTLFPILMPNIL